MTRHWTPTYRVRPKAIDTPGVWPPCLADEAAQLRSALIPGSDFIALRYAGGMTYATWQAQRQRRARIAARRDALAAD